MRIYSCKNKLLNNEITEKKISFVQKAIILLFPFITFLGPYISFLGINLSNFLSLLLIFFTVRKFLKRKYKNIKCYIIYFIIMIIYSLSTVIWSNYSSIGLTIFFPLVTGFIAMAFVASLNKKELEYFVDSISFLTLFIMIIAINEIIFGEYVLFNNSDFIDVINKYGFYYPGVAFANPNDLAQYLVCTVPLIVLREFDRKKIIFPVIVIVLTLFILFNTNSRLSIISFTMVLLSYFIFFIPKNKTTLGRDFFIIIFFCILINILSVIGVNLNQFGILDNFLLINMSENYFTARSSLYIDALNLGLDNFLMGAGLGGSYTVTTIGTHNMFLFIFADLGIMFVLGFSLVLVCAFLELYKYKKIYILNCHLASLMLSILVVFPIISSMSSANEQRKIVWIVLGIIFSVISNYKELLKDREGKFNNDI